MTLTRTQIDAARGSRFFDLYRNVASSRAPTLSVIEAQLARLTSDPATRRRVMKDVETIAEAGPSADRLRAALQAVWELERDIRADDFVRDEDRQAYLATANRDAAAARETAREVAAKATLSDDEAAVKRMVAEIEGTRPKGGA
jgi:hypothetical protein